MRTLDYLEVEVDSTFTFTYFKEENNQLIIPSAATIQILDASGNEKLAATVMTIAADGVVTYAWDSTGNAVGQNYQVIYRLDSRKPVVRFFDIYYYPFTNDITDTDLKEKNDVISDGIWEESGKAESGTTTTLIDSKLIDNDETWKGGLIEIYKNKESKDRKISSFDNTTGKITFNPALESTVEANDIYIARRSYQEKITQAGIKVQDDFRAMEKRAYLVIDHRVLKWLIIYRFFADYFGNLIKEENDEFDIQNKRYEGLYTNKLQSMSIVYDKNVDAIIDDGEDDTKVGEIRWLR